MRTQLIFSAGAVAGDKFGAAVAIDGAQIIVGAPGRLASTVGNQTFTQGEAFSYGLKSDGSWALETPADQAGTATSIHPGARCCQKRNRRW